MAPLRLHPALLRALTYFPSAPSQPRAHSALLSSQGAVAPEGPSRPSLAPQCLAQCLAQSWFPVHDSRREMGLTETKEEAMKGWETGWG